jgi:hypothetical protein
VREYLNVLETIQPVIEQAHWVAIDEEAIDHLAARLASSGEFQPHWDAALHPVGRNDDETATLVLVLDALNFCFWPLPRTTGTRWTVRYRGQDFDGYLALAAALRRAIDDGTPLADPDYLESLDLAKIRSILAPVPGAQEIPLLSARLTNLREVGLALKTRWGSTFSRAIRAADGSALDLIEELLAALPSFRDTAIYRGREVFFLKRAQILIADLHGALGGSGLGRFDDLDHLTAFADYKVPQILRRFRVLRYHPELAAMIRRYELISACDEREIEIRAATIWAVELLRRSLVRHERMLRAFEIDWLLWNASQTLSDEAEPYHRTLTVFY